MLISPSSLPSLGSRTSCAFVRAVRTACSPWAGAGERAPLAHLAVERSPAPAPRTGASQTRCRRARAAGAPRRSARARSVWSGARPAGAERQVAGHHVVRSTEDGHEGHLDDDLPHLDDSVYLPRSRIVRRKSPTTARAERGMPRPAWRGSARRWCRRCGWRASRRARSRRRECHATDRLVRRHRRRALAEVFHADAWPADDTCSRSGSVKTRSSPRCGTGITAAHQDGALPLEAHVGPASASSVGLRTRTGSTATRPSSSHGGAALIGGAGSPAAMSEPAHKRSYEELAAPTCAMVLEEAPPSNRAAAAADAAVGPGRRGAYAVQGDHRCLHREGAGGGRRRRWRRVRRRGGRPARARARRPRPRGLRPARAVVAGSPALVDTELAGGEGARRRRRRRRRRLEGGRVACCSCCPQGSPPRMGEGRRRGEPRFRASRRPDRCPLSTALRRFDLRERPTHVLPRVRPACFRHGRPRVTQPAVQGHRARPRRHARAISASTSPPSESPLAPPSNSSIRDARRRLRRGRLDSRSFDCRARLCIPLLTAWRKT